eukprot:IDg729t1
MHLYGPVEGQQPDNVMYTRSGVDKSLEETLFIEGKQYSIYGDAAYVLREWLVTAYPRHTANSAQVSFNKAMNSCYCAIFGRALDTGGQTVNYFQCTPPSLERYTFVAL